MHLTGNELFSSPDGKTQRLADMAPVEILSLANLMQQNGQTDMAGALYAYRATRTAPGLSPETPFTQWLAQQCIPTTPADEFDYRGAFGAAECDRIAAGMLSIADELVALVAGDRVSDDDRAGAVAEIQRTLQWAMRYLGIPPNAFPDERAQIRKTWGAEPGPQDCGPSGPF